MRYRVEYVDEIGRVTDTEVLDISPRDIQASRPRKLSASLILGNEEKMSRIRHWIDDAVDVNQRNSHFIIFFGQSRMGKYPNPLSPDLLGRIVRVYRVRKKL